MRSLKNKFFLFVLTAALMSTTAPGAAEKSGTLYPVIKDGVWGYINGSGKIIVKPKYYRAGEFSDGMGLVRTAKPDDKVFCIDSKGNIAFELEPSWTSMKPFSEGLAAVKDKETRLYGYVDSKGKVAIPFKYTTAKNFSEGLAKVEYKDAQNNTLVGYIDRKGEMAFKPDKWLKNDFSDGMASIRVEKDGKFIYGFINTKGKIIIEPKYKKVGLFGEGLAFVNYNDQIQIIDKKGTPVVKFDFKAGSNDKMPKFSEGYAKLYYNWKFPNGSWGFVDKKGKLAFPKLQISSIKTVFSEGRAWIKLRGNNDTILIDTKGKTYVSIANVDKAMEFQNGLSTIILKNEKNFYYYNSDGKLVWK